MKKFKTESQKVLDLMINSIYTNKEIFLRELLSNCSDAIDKLYYKSLTDGISGLSRGDFHIDIKLNKENKTITISDNGIGMNATDLEENLGTIAHSGSLDFKNNDKLKEEDINIIGQFGVGFYSAFMVAKKVEVISKAYGENVAYKWTSTGASGYDIKPCEKESNGTDIILYIKDNTENDTFDSYLEEFKIKSLVKKYSDYIRYPILMEVTKYKEVEGEGGKREEYVEKDTLNTIVPIWKKNKSEVKKEEYDTFYKESFFDGNNPIKTIHMSVEGAVDFKALLFIPETVPFNYYSKQYEKGLKLFTNGVMIMDKCQELLPDYFSFVKGIVDSEVTLNISRETVQQTRQITQIGASIEKKVKSELENLLKNERENYEKFYKAFGLQLKFGVYQTFGAKAEILKDLLLFYSLKLDKLVTLKEYVENMGANKEDIFYASGKTISAVKSLPKVEKLLNDGIDVLAFTDEVDEFAVKFMGEYDKKPFKNATGEGSSTTNEALEEDKPILDAVKEALKGKVEKVILTKSLVNHAVCLSTEGEISLEMEKVLSMQPGVENSVKAQKVLEINLNHAIYAKLKLKFEENKEEFNNLSEILYAQAALVAGLEVDNLSSVAEITINLLSK
ncbi:MAG: molecular chaperone HtpG [Clostridia bacterium]|nr:molecular chaperone HtpG [Clostridia bacterium]